MSESVIGLICLTEENKNKPWILFEAGALNKGLSSNRVCPILADLEPKDVDEPLSKFQLTKMLKDAMFKLLKSKHSVIELLQRKILFGNLIGDNRKRTPLCSKVLVDEKIHCKGRCPL